MYDYHIIVAVHHNYIVPSVLAPPLTECLQCERRLVQYHTCTVRCYTCTGVRIATKVGLRCLSCAIVYNYGQFGDKHSAGFRYYDCEREMIEVTDGVLFERQLLEMQCSLA